jgi:ABC-type bacteriocin/lantibiotic exporter with double-glycine peptidase domain
MIDVVTQEEETGCGLATVAMVAGQSYEVVKQRANGLGIFAHDQKLWSETEYVRRLLNSYGVVVSQGETPFVSWDGLPKLALLAITYHLEKGCPFWHWVLYVHENSGGPVVLDPAAYLADNRRRDFDQMSPEWFIEVTSMGLSLV